MNIVKIQSTFFKQNAICEGYLIQNMDDFFEYFNLERDIFHKQFKRAIQNKIPLHRWDHLHGYLNHGYNRAKILGGRPLMEANTVFQMKEDHIKKMLLDNKMVYVNKNGGYHEFSFDTHTIIESHVFDFKNKDIRIAKEPSYLNLENDPILENHTIEYFKKNNLELSYLVNLFSFSKDDLIQVFNDFKEKGGKGLYIYTTASDIPQMETYLSACVESNLGNVIIEFNDGFNDDHKKVINKFKTQLNLKYIVL